MTDLVEDFNISLNHPGQTDLAQMRENYKWLFMCSILAGVRDQKKCVYAPGWTTTITDTGSPQGYPSRIEVSKTYTTVSPNETWTFRFDLTWTGTNLTTIVCSFSDGSTSPLFTTVTGGTITCTYDGSGNLKTASTA